MTSDLIERLRAKRVQNPLQHEYGQPVTIPDPLCAEAADRIASLEAEVDALREQMEHEAASMWRGAVSNTVAVVDRVRNQFAKGLRLKKNVRLAHFDAELDIALGEWFDATRRTSPKSYAESEVLFRALLNRGDGNG